MAQGTGTSAGREGDASLPSAGLRFRYGVPWHVLGGVAAVLGALGLYFLWGALTNESAWEIGGVRFSPGAMRVLDGILAAVLGFCMAPFVWVALRQRGQAPWLTVTAEGLSVPDRAARAVDVPFASVRAWHVETNRAGAKVLHLVTEGRSLRIQGRLMPDYAAFDALVAAVRAGAADRELPAAGPSDCG
jgi:hypothetical protein